MSLQGLRARQSPRAAVALLAAITVAVSQAPRPLLAAAAMGAASIDTAAGSWTPLGPPGVSGLSSFAVSQQSARWMYAVGTDATHLYGTRNGGAGWVSLPVPPTGTNPATFVFGVAVDPLAATTVYVLTGVFFLGGHARYGMFRSTDGGLSWTELAATAGWVAVDPQDDRILYTGPLAERSADGGATWTLLAGLPADVTQLIIDPKSPANVYAWERASPNLYKSIDRGVTWTLPGTTIGDLTALCVEPANSSTLYAAAGGYLEKSVDGGVIWQIAYAPADPVNHGVTGVAAAPTTPTTVYGVVAGTAVVRSADGGQTWSALPTATLAGAVLGLAIDPQNPQRVIVSVDGAGLAAMTVPGSCSPAAQALCLASGGRFRVTTTWQKARASGVGQSIALTADTGAFWFFAASNLEVIVKVLDGCALNGRYWVFAAGLTNVGVTLTVTDTQTGISKSYTNPENTTAEPIQDTSAFSTCP